MDWWNGWSITLILLIGLVVIFSALLFFVLLKYRNVALSLKSQSLNSEPTTSCLFSTDYYYIQSKDNELSEQFYKLQSELDELKMSTQKKMNAYHQYVINSFQLDVPANEKNLLLNTGTNTDKNIENVLEKKDHIIQILNSRIETLNFKQQLLALHFQKQLEDKELMLKYQKFDYDSIL